MRWCARAGRSAIAPLAANSVGDPAHDPEHIAYHESVRVLQLFCAVVAFLLGLINLLMAFIAATPDPFHQHSTAPGPSDHLIALLLLLAALVLLVGSGVIVLARRFSSYALFCIAGVEFIELLANVRPGGRYNQSQLVLVGVTLSMCLLCIFAGVGWTGPRKLYVPTDLDPPASE